MVQLRYMYDCSVGSEVSVTSVQLVFAFDNLIQRTTLINIPVDIIQTLPDPLPYQFRVPAFVVNFLLEDTKKIFK